MSQPLQIDFQPTPVDAQDPAPCDQSDEVVTLGPDDFQRIGIQPKETRLEVIRRAASRAAKSLARRQLNAPNPVTEEQLSRIAISTYRLLDPRQRQDRQSRAHVGRIRPGALYRVGRTEFANEKILIQSCDSSETSIATHHREEWIGDGARSMLDSEASDPACSGRLGRVRRRATHPAIIVAMIVALLVTAGAIWKWGQELQTLRHRLIPVSSQNQSNL